MRDRWNLILASGHRFDKWFQRTGNGQLIYEIPNNNGMLLFYKVDRPDDIQRCAIAADSNVALPSGGQSVILTSGQCFRSGFYLPQRLPVLHMMLTI